jgi:uncharacterized protein YndB with AHSA1/START domain
VDLDLDPATTAGLVVREVRHGERDGVPTRVVVARRTYRTDRDDLWDAITNPERLPRWFMPVTGDLRPGGRFQLQGNAGGVVERCDAPEVLAVTWEYGGSTSWVTVTLVPDGAGTVLELAHEAPIDDTWERFGPGATGVGWDLALVGLGLHLDTGAALDPAAFEAFTLSATGVELVRHVATGWADAAAAGGDDAAEARAAAERTIAFYTTPPDDDPAGDGP